MGRPSLISCTDQGWFQTTHQHHASGANLEIGHCPEIAPCISNEVVSISEVRIWNSIVMLVLLASKWWLVWKHGLNRSGRCTKQFPYVFIFLFIFLLCGLCFLATSKFTEQGTDWCQNVSHTGCLKPCNLMASRFHGTQGVVDGPMDLHGCSLGHYLTAWGLPCGSASAARKRWKWSSWHSSKSYRPVPQQFSMSTPWLEHILGRYIAMSRNVRFPKTMATMDWFCWNPFMYMFFAQCIFGCMVYIVDVKVCVCVCVRMCVFESNLCQFFLANGCVFSSNVVVILDYLLLWSLFSSSSPLRLMRETQRIFIGYMSIWDDVKCPTNCWLGGRRFYNFDFPHYC